MDFEILFLKFRVLAMSMVMQYGQPILLLSIAGVALWGYVISRKRGYLVLMVAFALWVTLIGASKLLLNHHRSSLSDMEIQRNDLIRSEIQKVYETHGFPSDSYPIPKFLWLPVGPAIALVGIWMLIRKEKRNSSDEPNGGAVSPSSVPEAR